MIRISFLLVVQLFGALTSFAQKPTIQTPEVAAINKFLDVPVDKSTGVPSINIPIYTVSQNGFNLPISLSYHAGGIKVEEEATSVGLGWILNGGGVISRTIKKQPDELGGYYTSYGTSQPVPLVITPPYYPCSGCALVKGTVSDIVSGSTDTEPDLFYFNVNGISGKFVFDKNRAVKIIPEQDIKIETDQFFTEFKLINSDGVQYFFAAKEFSSSTDQQGNSSGNYTSAWRLTKIITTNKESIFLDYLDQAASFQKVISHEVFVSRNLECPGVINSISYNHLQQKNLQAIRFANGRIDFTYKSTYREDFIGNNGLSVNLMKALESIKVTNTINNQVIKEFKLTTSYFTSNNNTPYVEELYQKKRLRLDEILECDGTGNNCLPPYKFFYNKHNATASNYLPSRVSRGQDHWGFYNGIDNNNSLYTGLNCSGNANRNPDPAYNMAYILDEIVFPTQGIKKLLYESSSVGGGLRVKQISDDPGTLVQQIVTTNYYYENSVLIGGDPIYIQGIDVSDVLGLPGYNLFNLCDQFNPGVYPYYFVFQSPVNYTGEITSNFVIHGKVTEVKSGQGSIESEFDITHIQDEIDLEQAQTYPFIVTSPLLLTGKPIREVYKNQAGDILKEVTFDYLTTRNTIISSPDAYKVVKPLCMQQVRYYDLYTGFVALLSKTEIEYGSSSQTGLTSTERVTVFEYGGLSNPAMPIHHFVTKETVTSSQNDLLIKRKKYPLDYKVEIGSITGNEIWDNSSKGIHELISRNMIIAPIEQISTRVRNGVEKVLNGELIKFKERQNSQSISLIRPESILRLNVADPLNYGANFFSKIIKSGNSYQFTSNSNYEEETSFLKFDDLDNPSEIKGKDGITESYLWAHNKTLLVAKVMNAQVKDVFYTSFEESLGNSTDGDCRTGRKSKVDGFSISLANLSNGSYNLSYWYKSGGTWTHQNNIVVVNSGSYIINLTGQVDEVRFHPSNSFITTYSYLPLVGIIHQCDINNRINSYEYDNFNRLVLIRDDDNKVIKKICYNYAGQPENCLLPCDGSNSAPEWQNTATALRCQVIAGQNTGYQEQEQKDMNPCSSSFNQLQWVPTVYNTAACPLPAACNSGNCSGNDKKCINGVCETGVWVVISATRATKNDPWTCVWAYCFSDGSYSTYTQTTTSSTMCAIGCY